MFALPFLKRSDQNQIVVCTARRIRSRTHGTRQR